MPYKDVKVNGQIRYLLQRQEISSLATNMNETEAFSLGGKSHETHSSTNQIEFASCFKDGVYRYLKGLFKSSAT